jgi:flavin reductase (DIM6/NTAB) family NADH-FMN oxidoreductase RutF
VAKREISWSDYTDLLREALDGDGAFLVVLDPNGRPNPMTIGWGEVGIVWSRPAFTVLVRPSRYTHACILAADSFTVSVPRPGNLTEALLLCGTKSGRDVDKVKTSRLCLATGTKVRTPVVEGCALQYECRILARAVLTRQSFASPDVLSDFYPTSEDYHLIVVGEILAAYAESDLVSGRS